MIEAVGEQYLPAYFAALDRLLKPGGWIGLQAITMPHQIMLSSRKSYTWMRKYIFPRGLLPSLQLLEEHVRDHTDCVSSSARAGLDYVKTLRDGVPGLWRIGMRCSRSASTRHSSGCGVLSRLLRGGFRSKVHQRLSVQPASHRVEPRQMVGSCSPVCPRPAGPARCSYPHAGFAHRLSPG